MERGTVGAKDGGDGGQGREEGGRVESKKDRSKTIATAIDLNPVDRCVCRYTYIYTLEFANQETSNKMARPGKTNQNSGRCNSRAS